jgi:hypothetical protein
MNLKFLRQKFIIYDNLELINYLTTSFLYRTRKCRKVIEKIKISIVSALWGGISKLKAIQEARATKKRLIRFCDSVIKVVVNVQTPITINELLTYLIKYWGKR